MATSSHLNWLIVRDQNAFLIKRRNIKKPFSKVSITFNPQNVRRTPFMMTFCTIQDL